MQPLIVSAVVRDLRIGSAGRLGWNFVLVLLLSLACLIASLTIQQTLWNGARVGLRAKIALSAAAYSKTLSLGNAANTDRN